MFHSTSHRRGWNLIGVENDGKLIESVGNPPDWPDEDWNGPIDGDLEIWAGSVTVFNAPLEGDPHPWAMSLSQILGYVIIWNFGKKGCKKYGFEKTTSASSVKFERCWYSRGRSYDG
jgi:hypothetical protein